MKIVEHWRIWATGLILALVIIMLGGALMLSDALRSSDEAAEDEGTAGENYSLEDGSDNDDDYGITFLPSSYDLADMGKKPSVRSQGNTGTCWALSSVSALESDLLPETEMIFSADHMSMNNGFALTQDDGGDYYMIMSYLSDWKGPVLEEEDPYGDGESPDGLSAAVHVQEIRLLKDMTQDEIKRVIYECGAVQSSLSMDRERTDTDEYHYYNSKTCAYFSPLTENVSHDILVLGWDDRFSRENFRIKPREDGAWICQNTWGGSFGVDGIFYVSYEDKNLFRKGGLAYTRIEPTDNYDHVYENDSLGWQGRQGYDKDSCWFAGAFTAGSDEILSAAGLYSVGEDTTCRIYVIPHFTGKEDLEAVAELAAAASAEGAAGEAETEEMPTASAEGAVGETETEEMPAASAEGAAAEPDSGNLSPEIICAAKAQMNMAGFYTVDMDQEIALEEGQEFAIAVWIETKGESKPAAVEMAKDRFTQNVTFEGRQTWISSDGEYWENTQEDYQTNVCLKAYTRDQGI